MGFKVNNTTVLTNSCQIQNINNYNVSGTNLFAGVCAGMCNTTGNNNNFIGAYSGPYNTTGSNNFFIGRHAGWCNTAGSCNT